MQSIETDPSVSEKARAFFRKHPEGHWLAIGIDILTHTLADHDDDPPTRPELRDQIDQMISTDLDEGLTHDPKDIEVAKAWLEIHPDHLYAIANEALAAGVNAVTNNLVAMAAGSESGSNIGNIVCEAYSDAILKWRDDLQESP